MYNPKIHNRHSIRLKGYDYSKSGAYFITICCHDRLNRFGEIEIDQFIQEARMELNEFGEIAFKEWIELEKRFPNVKLDVFQIMPNHMHGIIVIQQPAGAGFTPAHSIPDESKSPTIGDIVGAYKSIVANKCLEIFKSRNKKMGKFWQRDYWDIIIRSKSEYENIANYIMNNPANWLKDKFNRSQGRS